MTEPKITQLNPARGGEGSNPRAEALSELSRRGLLAADRESESPGESGGFVRAVRVPRRARGQGSSWPTNRMA
jgi:hypothetical protein